MARSNYVLVFPQEHNDLLGAVRTLSIRSKTDGQLRSFLKTVTHSLNDFASTLNGAEKAAIGGSEDLLELAERHTNNDRRNTVVEMVLLTTVQVAELLAIMQESPELFSTSVKSNTIATGYGVGLLAAAIGATARNADDIVTLGARATSIVSRLALQLERNGKDIESLSEDWARIVVGSNIQSVQQQIQKLNEGLNPLQHAYLGQDLPDGLVVHGPPSTLNAFAAQASASTLISSLPSPYNAPTYGAHLPPVDVNEILGGSSKVDSLMVQRLLLSAHTPNESISGATFGTILQSAVVEIAHKSVEMNNAMKTMAAKAQKTGASKLIILSIGSTWDASSLKDVLSSYEQEVVIENFVSKAAAMTQELDTVSPDAIAVVGMSGRFPQSDSLEELWSLLTAGITTHQEIPKDRFSVEDFYDPTREKHNALVQKYACFLKNPGDFDHRLFNISPKEALQMDPVQRMLLMITYEALEMAGYSEGNEKTPAKIATYFGQTVDDWKTINQQKGIDTHFLPAVNRGFAPGRLCHYFRWASGFYSIDTGCSSSATGVCIARDALLAGNCDAAIVGGGTLLTTPEWFSGLGQGGFLSPTGACKTYSAEADGYCRGEGVAIVVLKRLQDAIRAKDNVLAVISGASRNTNAGEGSITHPGQHAQENLYRRTMRQAGVSPAAVNVVEMHGTGTQAGDKVESTAVHNVFVAKNKSRKANPLTIGAIKANIGHSEAAAGVVSLIKAILMLQHSTLPAQVQPKKLNPKLHDLFAAGMQLARGQAFPRIGTDPRYIFINNFDAAGGNVSMLIQDPPTQALQQPCAEDDRSYHVVATSGRTQTALAANKERLRQYLTHHPETQLASIAYTSTARRMHQTYRQAYVAASVADLLRYLESPSTGPSVASAASSVTFAFTGQGSQYVGMGGTLYKTSLTFRRLLDSYQRLCDAQGLECDFISVVNGTASNDSKTLERDLQIATVAIEIALAKYWQMLGIQPTLLIGHSLGEFAAMCTAGVLSVSDTLTLVHKRATLITTRNQPSEAAMLAVALPASTAQWRIRDSAVTSVCEICCINGPSSTVIGGPVDAIEVLEANLKAEGLAATRLATKYAFHTRQMDVFVEELEQAASKVRFNPPQTTIASTLLGKLVKAGEKDVFNAEYIRRHTREPVHFFDSVRVCEAEGLIKDQSFIVEIGPHPVCIGLIASGISKGDLYSFPSLHRKRDDWETISQCMAAAYKAQLPVSWSAFHQDHLEHLRLISDLPTYAFEMETFWHTYKTEVGGIAASQQGASNRLPYTTLQTVEELRKEDSKLVAVFKSETAEPNLRQAIGGHVVDGVAICPASVFMDMAYSAAEYLDRQSGNENSSITAYDLTDVKMTSPLVLRPDDDEPPTAIVEATLDLSTKVVAVTFKSCKEGVSLNVGHGSCSVVLNQRADQTWSRMKVLVEGRMNRLNTSLRPSEVYAFDRKLFYKHFSEIVDYDGLYHAVEEAIIATGFGDASIVLKLPQHKDVGTFASNPFAIDSIVHVAGFLLNADVSRGKEEVHICNNIGSTRVLGDLSLQKPCTAYATVRERDEKTGTSLCDVYVTNEDNKLVAMCTDICFKKLDRDFFSMLTGSNRARATPKPKAPPMKRTHSSASSGPPTPLSIGSPISHSSASDVVDLSEELFNAIAKRTGISMADLQKSSADMTFTDLGVDSQMSIQVLSDFQKSTAVELPAAFFTNFPTPAAAQEELNFSPLDDDEADAPAPKSKPEVAPPAAPKASKTKTSSKPAKAKDGPSKQLMGLVAKALGHKPGDLSPDTTFEEIGMDSMLSIKIISQFQKESGVELPAAFFTEYQTVAAALEELDGPVEEEAPPAPAPVKAMEPAQPAAPVKSERQQKFDDAVSRAVLIQGKSRNRDAPLFMTTDGSGTVESYIHLSALPKGRRIYALESPFLQADWYLDFSIQEMATIFIRSIRKIQPKGPYLIGGWSAGSMYAYEVAHRLASEGETIQELIILDMRAPSLIPTNIVTLEFVDTLGTFEGINRARDLPEDLSTAERTHLMATCRALSQYDAPEFPADRRPLHSSVIWARLGLEEIEGAPKAAMHRPQVSLGKPLDQITLDEYQYYFNSWFYGRREDFGKNGWEDFLGDNISVYDVDGDHFSMMVPPLSTNVGKIVTETIRTSFGDE